MAIPAMAIDDTGARFWRDLCEGPARPPGFGWNNIRSRPAVQDLAAFKQGSRRVVGDAILVDSRDTYATVCFQEICGGT